MSLSLGLGIVQSLYAFHARLIELDALCTRGYLLEDLLKAYYKYEFRDNTTTNYPPRSLSPY